MAICDGQHEYATLKDLATMWRNVEQSEINRAGYLLKTVSSSLREEAKKVGKNLDQMIASDPDLADVARSVVVDVVARALMTSTDHEPMTQVAESAGGYTASGTFLVPGGGLFIKRSELARLGLRRQRVGVISFYGTD